MGRRKIDIEKRSVSHQVVTYNKRKDGIAKKARQLAILCDTDVLLLTFSPKGNHNLTLGPNSDFENVIRRYAGLGPHEREKRKKDSVQTLVKAFKKIGNHEIDVDGLLNPGDSEAARAKKIADLNMEMERKEKMLGPLIHIENLNSIDTVYLLANMENKLKALLNQNQKQMEKIQQNMQEQKKMDTPAFHPQVMNQQGPSNVHQISGSASATPSSHFHANDMQNMSTANTSVLGDGFSMDFMLNAFNDGNMPQQGGSGEEDYLLDLPIFPPLQ